MYILFLYTATLPSFLKDFKNDYNKHSKIVVADAGYGSEQNYEFMEDNQMEAFVKYNYFHKEQKRAWKKNPFAVQNLFYNKDKDFFICPMGQHMINIGQKKNKSDLGYISTITRYQAQNCNSCPLRCLCHKSMTNRTIEVNYKLDQYKKQARERLLSEQGIYHRGKRCIEPEVVFAQIKYNHQFNRFRLSGLQKVNIEFTLVAITHNLRKWAGKLAISQILFVFTCLKWILYKYQDKNNESIKNQMAA